MLDFVKMMYTAGCPIEGYVGLTITAEDYKAITGKSYVEKEATKN